MGKLATALPVAWFLLLAADSTTLQSTRVDLLKDWESGNIGRRTIVALVDSECPEIDYELEQWCSDLQEITNNRNCLKLPFAEQPRLQDRKHAMRRTTYLAMFRRLVPALSQLGFDISAKPLDRFLASHRAMETADILIVAEYTLTEIAFHKELGHARFIVVQTSEIGTIPRLACEFGDQRILAFLQHTALYPLLENNGPLIDDQRLMAWLDPMNVSIQMRQPEITKEELKKVYTVIPYVYRYLHPLDCGGRKWFLQLQPAFEKSRAEWLLPLEDRRYDVVIVAAANPLYPPAKNEHRLMALQMVEYLEQRHQLQVRTFIRQPTTREFFDTVQNAKVFVSPFGHGEAAGHDYEAILNGAVLVKPNSMRLRSFPDIYSGGYSVSCQSDFSDLEQVVMTVLGHLERAQALVDTAYSKLVRDSSVENVVHTLGDALKEIVSSPAATEPLVGASCKPGFFTADDPIEQVFFNDREM
uniref:Uncharacterized protein n=1 Tax=Tetraselmis sp. GSL018 TaxID=582737 RepID=A0A061QX74_9CHLO